MSKNGPDLDTMSICAFQALYEPAQNPRRPHFPLLKAGKLCNLLCATRKLVSDDTQTGLDFVAEPLPGNSANLHYTEFVTIPGAKPTLTIKADRKPGLETLAGKRALRDEVTRQNPGRVRFPNHQRIAMKVGFRAETFTGNILDLSIIEPVIDAAGASQVGEQRLFDRAKGQQAEFGYDDSMISSLVAARVSGMPKGLDIHMDFYTQEDALRPWWAWAGW